MSPNVQVALFGASVAAGIAALAYVKVSPFLNLIVAVISGDPSGL